MSRSWWGLEGMGYKGYKDGIAIHALGSALKIYYCLFIRARNQCIFREYGHGFSNDVWATRIRLPFSLALFLYKTLILRDKLLYAKFLNRSAPLAIPDPHQRDPIFQFQVMENKTKNSNNSLAFPLRTL